MSDSVENISEGSNSLVEEGVTVCQMCLKCKSKYTCPRCNSPYCSLECYRCDKHKNCSEGFYKDCFIEGLKEYVSNPEEKQKVLEMLKRAETDPGLSDLDEPGDDLDERLADLDIEKDSNDVWNRLTDQEKKEFQLMVGDGRLGSLVELWSPWWTVSIPLVSEIKESSASAKSSSVPNVSSEIANISQILKTKPSSDVKYNVINLLYTYCYVCRLHNGDQVSMAAESADDIMTLSDVLGQGHTCRSVEEAVQLCMKKLINRKNNYESTPEFNVLLLKDVEKVVTGSGKCDSLSYTLAALSEICQIFKKAHKYALKKLKVEKISGLRDKYKKSKAKLFQVSKKCQFYLSWAQTYGMALCELVPELQMVYSLSSAELEVVNQSKKKLEAEWGGKVKPKKEKLIEVV